MIQVLILTKDEDQNIGECINTLEFIDDIIVLDTFSSYDTLIIAQKIGDKVHQRKFYNYAMQRNLGLSLNFKYD